MTALLPGLPSNPIRSTFDSNDNTRSVTVPKGYTHNFAPNGVNLLATYDPPQGTPSVSPLDTTYAYDRDSLLKQLIEPSTSSATVTYSYENGSRLLGFSHPSATVSLLYFPTGHVQEIDSNNSGQASANLTYTYDGSLLTGESYSSSDSRLTASVSYDYDAVLRPLHRTIQNKATTQAFTFSYDNDSLIKDVALAGVDYAITRAPGTGLLQSTSLGSVNDCYDRYGSVTTYVACSGTCTPGSATCNSGTLLYGVTYTREASTGRILTKAESVNGTTQTFNYTYSTASTPGTFAANQLYTANGAAETYDLDGNRAGYTYDAQDRMTNYGWNVGYDNNGDAVQQQSGASLCLFPYDPLGNLRGYNYTVANVSQPSSSTYLIDGRNRRVAKLHVNDATYFYGYLYDSQDRIIARLDQNGLRREVRSDCAGDARILAARRRGALGRSVLGLWGQSPRSVGHSTL